ncbi:hypothetical protein [Hoeflea poritis]|uniref:Uncharacterized protein n=1 Tax=Hoeflea poritis TaxID=2993659 RepID=A0ABT4VQP7_9HYPH|nr:hypothetical protein [Hoeflea poritis]MDA4847040.1 hypothetical protein [Hoeflea poritis]
MSRSQARILAKTLRERIEGYRFCVKRHSSRTLARAQSLQSFLAPFTKGAVVYDPTGVFSRARTLVSLSLAARECCGDIANQFLWHSRTATLFVVVNDDRLSAGGYDRCAVIERVENTMSAALAAETGGDSAPVVRIRVGDRRPLVATTPVDDQSIRTLRGQLNRTRKRLYAAFLAATFGVGSVAAARAQDPAVSAPNGELAILGGVRDGDGAVALEGAAVVPLGDQFGARFDGVFGSIDGELVVGGAGHFFWRDPEVGLVGVAGGYVHSNADTLFTSTQDIWVIAGQAEGYFEDVTVSGMVGYQSGNGPNDDGVLGRLDVEWYSHDDLMLAIGAETNPQHDLLGRVGVEYRPGIEALPGLSVFADGSFGDSGYARAFAGVRLYFGPSTTLKDKHRRDTFRSHLLPTRMIDGLSDEVAAYGD